MFGPLKKVPERLLDRHLVFSRAEGEPKRYVQDELRDMGDEVAAMLTDPATHIYICGLKGMEEGVEKALTNIAESIGQPWSTLRVLDPLAGGGTTLFVALVLGADALGVEQSARDVASTASFLQRYLGGEG